MSYLVFNEQNYTSKTKIVYVENLQNQQLAIIKWYAPWRKYCFIPNSEIIFDSKCLNEMLLYLDKINLNHKDGRSSNKI